MSFRNPHAASAVPCPTPPVLNVFARFVSKLSPRFGEPQSLEHLEADISVRNLKEMLHRECKFPVPVDQMVVRLGNRVLSDASSLLAAGLRDGCTIDVALSAELSWVEGESERLIKKITQLAVEETESLRKKLKLADAKTENLRKEARETAKLKDELAERSLVQEQFIDSLAVQTLSALPA